MSDDLKHLQRRSRQIVIACVLGLIVLVLWLDVIWLGVFALLVFIGNWYQTQYQLMELVRLKGESSDE